MSFKESVKRRTSNRLKTPRTPKPCPDLGSPFPEQFFTPKTSFKPGREVASPWMCDTPEPAEFPTPNTSVTSKSMIRGKSSERHDDISIEFTYSTPRETSTEINNIDEQAATEDGFTNILEPCNIAGRFDLEASASQRETLCQNNSGKLVISSEELSPVQNKNMQVTSIDNPFFDVDNMSNAKDGIERTNEIKEHKNIDHQDLRSSNLNKSQTKYQEDSGVDDTQGSVEDSLASDKFNYLTNDTHQDSEKFDSVINDTRGSDEFESEQENNQDSEKFDSVINDTRGSDEFESEKENSQDSEKFDSVINDTCGSDEFESEKENSRDSERFGGEDTEGSERFDTLDSERFDSDIDDTQDSEKFDSETEDTRGSDRFDSDDEFNKDSPSQLNKPIGNLATVVNDCDSNNKDPPDDSKTPKEVNSILKRFKTDPFKDIEACEKLLKEHLISNPEPHCEKVTLNQSQSKDVDPKDLHIKMLECNMETLVEQIHQFILENKEMKIKKKELEEKTKLCLSLNPCSSAEIAQNEQRRNIKLMTLELESLRSEVEKYDREKMIEMVKQRAVQKDQEIASLYKELENLSLQQQMDKNSLHVLHKFFTGIVEKDNKSRMDSDKIINDHLALLKNRINVMENEVKKQEQLIREKQAATVKCVKPVEVQENLKCNSDPVPEVSFFDIIVQKRKQQKQENQSIKSICIDFQKFTAEENQEHQVGERAYAKKTRKRKFGQGGDEEVKYSQDAARRFADVMECFKQWMITLNHPAETTRNIYLGIMRQFFNFWCKLEPDWDPTTLLFMNEEGPIPKLPPLETYVSRSTCKVLRVNSTISAYQKFCDFLLSHLYTAYFLTMDDVRYNRCRENLKGQRQMALETAKKNRAACSMQAVKKRKEKIRNGSWSERPEDLFRLMAKFATLDVVKDHMENMHKGFYVKFRMHTWSIIYIRDFLMACLLVMGGGHRGDVIRNMTLEEWNDRIIEVGAKDQKVAIVTVYKHKTGSIGPAYLTIHDMRVHKLMELYCQHVRPKFLSFNRSKEREQRDPANVALTFFLDKFGKKLVKVKTAVNWFKKRVVEAGVHTLEELKYLSARDFRSCISSWASDHKNQAVRLNAAALQNHSAKIHEAVYRKNKIRQAMGQSLALQRDLSQLAGTATNDSEDDLSSDPFESDTEIEKKREKKNKNIRDIAEAKHGYEASCDTNSETSSLFQSKNRASCYPSEPLPSSLSAVHEKKKKNKQLMQKINSQNNIIPCKTSDEPKFKLFPSPSDKKLRRKRKRPDNNPVWSDESCNEDYDTENMDSSQNETAVTSEKSDEEGEKEIVQAPISTLFDFGEFAGIPGTTVFNERQSQLIEKIFEEDEDCTLEQIEKAVAKSANFERLWTSLVDRNLNKTANAVKVLIAHIHARRRTKKRLIESNVIYNDI